MTEVSLVEFLRYEADSADSDGVPDTAQRFREAAGEIERLKAENREQNTRIQFKSDKRSDLDGNLASLCDRMNTWARELGTEESTEWKELDQMQQLLDRVVFAAKAKMP